MRLAHAHDHSQQLSGQNAWCTPRYTSSRHIPLCQTSYYLHKGTQNVFATCFKIFPAGLLHQGCLIAPTGLLLGQLQQQQCSMSSRRTPSLRPCLLAEETPVVPTSVKHSQLLTPGMGSRPEEASTAKVVSGTRRHAATQKGHTSRAGLEPTHLLYLRYVHN